MVQNAQKCCFWLPLRPGILAVGYFKLVGGIGTSIYVGMITFHATAFIATRHELHYFIIVDIMLILGIIFDTLFIINTHKKNANYLRIYSLFLMVQLLFYLVVLFIYIVHARVQYDSATIVKGVSIIFVLMVLHVYFMYLVRSVTRKLQGNSLFTFTAHGGEPMVYLIDRKEHSNKCNTHGHFSDREVENLVRNLAAVLEIRNDFVI